MIASFSWRHKEYLFVTLEYAFTAMEYYFPCKGWCYIFSFFCFPYITWEGSTVGIKFVFKRFDMVIIPLFFEFSFSQSKIYFFQVTGCCCTFVYQAFISAITIDLSQLYSYTRKCLVFLPEQSFFYAFWLFVTCFE